MRPILILIILLAVSLVRADDPFAVPKGLSPLKIPSDNPMTPEKVALGKQLFFDKRLSVDSSVSCASCHDPKKGWSNAEQFATGVGGQKGGRNAPPSSTPHTSHCSFGMVEQSTWRGNAWTH